MAEKVVASAGGWAQPVPGLASPCPGSSPGLGELDFTDGMHLHRVHYEALREAVEATPTALSLWPRRLSTIEASIGSQAEGDSVPAPAPDRHDHHPHTTLDRMALNDARRRPILMCVRVCNEAVRGPGPQCSSARGGSGASLDRRAAARSFHCRPTRTTST